MKWANVGDAHWNTDCIKAFCWAAGKLLVWWTDEPEGPEYYKDPDRAKYKRLCLCLGLSPLEVGADGES